MATVSISSNEGTLLSSSAILEVTMLRNLEALKRILTVLGRSS
jgi:hypothetical protein